MSFSIERYKEESRKLDIAGVNWEQVTDSRLSKGDLFCLHYMMDIENHVPLYLSHLLVTRACMDPILTAFLACWNYEELWHGENLGRFLNLYGIEFDTQDRIANVRANLGFQNTFSILSTMTGSWLMKDFSAVYLSIGAINELTTLTGYGALIRRSGHPVLKDLLSRIIKDERRHFAFYFNSSKEWLTGNRKAQRVDRWMLDRVWVPVGQGVKTQEEVDALALYLFDDEQGEAELLGIDEKIGRLPGLSGIKLMSKALYSARERALKTPHWGLRLIENEEWAVKAPKKSPIGELTSRRLPADDSGEAVLEGEAVSRSA
ncbi:MAG TPA: ferritin-like domain-containing protein [Chloroflexota bacterium]|nr:ferritin-like domain-containing protein [Chloroflexota bacterium]